MHLQSAVMLILQPSAAILKEILKYKEIAREIVIWFFHRNIFSFDDDDATRNNFILMSIFLSYFQSNLRSREGEHVLATATFELFLKDVGSTCIPVAADGELKRRMI